MAYDEGIVALVVDSGESAEAIRAALDAFVLGGMPPDCAKQAVTLIAKGLIPNIRITY